MGRIARNEKTEREDQGAAALGPGESLKCSAHKQQMRGRA